VEREADVVVVGGGIAGCTVALALRDRGALRPGHFADVVVFDPGSIADRATYEIAQQYSTGMVHVFVNGTQVLRDGEHTGALPGRVVRGPGWIGWTDEDVLRATQIVGFSNYYTRMVDALGVEPEDFMGAAPTD